MNASSRRLLGFADQALVSATTVLLLVAAGRTLPLEDFGRYSVGMATVQPCHSIVRAVVGESLIFRVVSHRGEDRGQGWLPDFSAAVSLSLGLGGLLAGALGVASFLWPSLSAVIAVAGAVAWALIVQDALRHVLMVKRRNVHLFVADAVLLATTIGGMLLLGHAGAGSAGVLAAWGLGAVCSIAVASWGLTLTISLRAAFAWLRSTGRSSSAFLVDSVAGSLIGYSIVVVLAIVSSPVAVAAYKTVVSVFGLTSVAINFLRTTFLRELDGNLVWHARGLNRLMIRVCMLVTSVVGMTLLLVMAVPERWGVALFGEIWPQVVGLSVVAALNRVMAGVSVGPLIALRVQGVSWKATRARLISMAVAGPAVALCAALFGPAGAIVGEAGLYLSIGVAWYAISLRAAEGR